MKKTLLVGNFGAHNLGDELILLSALKKYPGAVVMTSDADFSQNFTEQQFQTVPFPPTGPRSFWQFLTKKGYGQNLVQLKNTEITEIVFPGGGLFAIKWQACWLWFLIFRFLRRNFPEAEIKFEHQGVDQNLSWISKRLTRWVFSRVDFVSVRDESSGEALQVLGIKKYVLSEDVAWEWLRDREEGVVNRDHSRVVRKLCLVNAIKPFDVSSIEAKYSGYEIIFVPFAPSDLSVLPDDFLHEVIFPKTKTELLDLFDSAETLIGERFHSIVLGAYFCGNKNTFTLREPYSEKVEAFCETQQIKRFA